MMFIKKYQATGPNGQNYFMEGINLLHVSAVMEQANAVNGPKLTIFMQNGGQINIQGTKMDDFMDDMEKAITQHAVLQRPTPVVPASAVKPAGNLDLD